MESGGSEAIINGKASPKSFMLLYFWLTTLIAARRRSGLQREETGWRFAPLIRGALKER
jgi:hypothetical protein